MPLLVRKADDLVLERRAIPWADTAKLSVEQRGSIDVGPHERADSIVGVKQVAVDLLLMNGGCLERERHRRIVAAFDGERAVADAPLEIDARTIQPRRRACLQTSALKSDCPD